MITVRTPLRLSIAGGGTDLPEWYRSRPASLLSVTIDLYVRVEICEHGAGADDALSNLFATRNPGWRAMVSADCSPGAGLGGSGALAVCLAAAECIVRGDTVDPSAVAAEAYRWERSILGQPVGFQDHFSTAFGSATRMTAGPEEKPTAHVDDDLADHLDWLLDHALVISDTPTRRPASRVLAALSRSSLMRHGDDNHRPVRVDEMEVPIRARDGAALGQLLRRHWAAKRRNLPEASTDYLDECVAAALDAGATGAKVIGAGGGGFLMVSGPPVAREETKRALTEIGCTPRSVRVCRSGVHAEHSGCAPDDNKYDTSNDDRRQ
jgi:D-glycero-alpha-D-manno-heptose-7-phosphate kinase